MGKYGGLLLLDIMDSVLHTVWDIQTLCRLLMSKKLTDLSISLVFGCSCVFVLPSVCGLSI